MSKKVKNTKKKPAEPIKVEEKPRRVNSTNGYSFEQFMKFVGDRLVENKISYEVIRTKDDKGRDTYVVTIHDRGISSNRRLRFAQRRFVDWDLMQIRNEIREYLARFNIKGMKV